MNSFIAISLLAVFGMAVGAPAKYEHAGGHHHAVVPGPAVVHTYPAVAPAVKCGHNLLISCDTHHAAVPCHAAHEHGHGGYGGHAPAPAHHDAPAPSYHHAPAAPAYHHEAPAEYRAKKHGKKHGKKHFKNAEDSSSADIM